MDGCNGPLEVPMRSTVQEDHNIEGAILAIGNGWGNIVAGRIEEEGPENEAGAPDQACGYMAGIVAHCCRAGEQK